MTCDILKVKAEIADACRACGRNPLEVELVAVSKFHPQSAVLEALEAGHFIFGENRVQEAEEKFTGFKERFKDLKLHMIGSLQTNKVKSAVKLFDVIETVDSLKLAQALKDEMQKQGRILPCYIQVNIGDEPQKGGVSPLELESFYKTVVEKIGLNIVGLMCIPPEGEIPDMYFALMNKMAREMGLKKLSMGMSADFACAIKYGATSVRIGTAIFGER